MPVVTNRPSGHGRSDAPRIAIPATIVERSDSSGNSISKRTAWLTLSVVCLSSVLMGLQTSSLNVALPKVVFDLDASPVEANWILLSSMLTMTSLVIVFGRLADMFGRKSMYMGGLALFSIASLFAGFSAEVWVLITWRIVQAIGGAMLITNSAAILTDVFPRRSLGPGMGIYAASFAVAQLVGPSLGGLITTSIGWSWIFWINAPIGLLCLIWGMMVMPHLPRHGHGQRIDFFGNVLLLIMLSSLLVALTQLSELGWLNPVVLAGFVLFMLILPSFVLLELHHPSPVLDVRMFRRLSFSAPMGATFLNAVAHAAVVVLMSLYLQTVQGRSAAQTGVQLLPLAVAAVFGSTSSGFLMRWVNPRSLAATGSGFTAIGLGVLIIAIHTNGTYLFLSCGLVLIGYGAGTFLPSNTVALIQNLGPDRVGLVNSVRLMIQSTGAVISTSVALTILTTSLPRADRQLAFVSDLADAPVGTRSALVVGYVVALTCMAVLATLAVVCSMVGGRADRRSSVPAVCRTPESL